MVHILVPVKKITTKQSLSLLLFLDSVEVLFYFSLIESNTNLMNLGQTQLLPQ